MSRNTQTSSRKGQRKKLPGFTATDKRRLASLVLFLSAAGGLIAWLSHDASRQTAPIPPFLQASEIAGQLPTTVEPDHFKDRVIREAYAVASKMPGVLAQQPCYCWCNSIGHRSLLDCYRTQHAATCDICVKEALLAGRMHDAGKTAQEIRTAIIAGEWNSVK
jgi:hypothetical protein